MMHTLDPILARPAGAGIFPNAIAAFDQALAQIQDYFRGQLGQPQVFTTRRARLVNLPEPASFYEGTGWGQVITSLRQINAISPSRTTCYVVCTEDVLDGDWGFFDSGEIIAIAANTAMIDGLAGSQFFRSPVCRYEEPWCARGALAHEILHLLGVGHTDQPDIDNLSWDWWTYPDAVLLDSEKAIARNSPWITDTATAGQTNLLPLLALGGLSTLGLVMATRRR